MNRLDPTTIKLLAEMPMPNLPGNQDNLQGFKVNEMTYRNFSERVRTGFHRISGEPSFASVGSRLTCLNRTLRRKSCCRSTE